MDFLEMNLKVYFLVSFSGLVGPRLRGLPSRFNAKNNKDEKGRQNINCKIFIYRVSTNW